MGLILRTTHENMPDGAIVANGRLTVQQMDNNFIFLQSMAETGGTGTIGATGAAGPIGATGAAGPIGATGADGFASLSVVTLTVASASQYISDSLIITGQPYLITDADHNLYGTSSQFGFGEGTNILLYGVSENSFTSIGSGKFYSPNYNEFDVWDQGLTYSVDDKVIYGGKVWNLTATASVGYNDYWSLQSDWEVVDYTDTYFYNVVWDEVEYNIVDNYITSRYDAINNNRVTDSYGTWYFMCETHPIQSFRWGHNSVQNCKVDNSYFGCLNFVSGYIWDVELKNGSMIWDIYLRNNARLQTITLSNFSDLSSFIIDGGYVQNINISNGSSFGEFTIESDLCYLENISINNNSRIVGFVLSQEDYNSCYIYGITIDNDSAIENFSLHSNNSGVSYFRDLTLTNDSYVSGITATASILENISVSNESLLGYGLYMENANISRMELNNNGFFIGGFSVPTGSIGDGFITITDSYIQNTVITNWSMFTGPIAITNNSIIDKLYMENSYIGGREQNYDDLFSITIEDSTIYNLILEGDSYISNVEIHSSTLSNTKLSNRSSLTSDDNSVYITDSTLDLISLSNYSEISGYLIIDNSTLQSIDLNTSFLGGSNYNFNLIDSTLQYVNLSNGSWFTAVDDEINIKNSSTVEHINLTNGSYIDGYLEIGEYGGNTYTGDSYLGYLDLTNDSYFGYGVHVNSGSELKNIKLENNSRLVGYSEDNNIYIYQNSTMQNIEITNDSYLSGYMDLGEGSYFQNIKIDNNSRISAGIYVYGWDSYYFNQGSTFENVTVTNDSSILGNITIGSNNGNQDGYGYLGNVTVTNGSLLGDNNIYVKDHARLEYITINNYSRFTKAYLTGTDPGNNPTKMYYIDINNYSYISLNALELYDGSEIKYLTLDNHSHIMGETFLHEDSMIKRIQMSNYSKIDGYNQMWSNSSIQYVSMINVSDNSGTSCYGAGFTDFYLDGSTLHGLEMEFSTLGGLWLNDSRIEGLKISNSRVFNIDISGTSSLLNSKISNSYLDGDSIDPGHYGSLLLYNGSWIENLDIDTVDFPAWNSGDYGITLDNSSIKNMRLKDMTLNDRVIARENNYGNTDGLIARVSLEDSYMENINIENCGETYDIWEGYIYDIHLNSSFISGLNMNKAQLDGLTASSSSAVVNLKLEDSGLYNLFLGEGSTFVDVEFTNCYGNMWDNYLTFGALVGGLKFNSTSFYNNSFNDGNFGYGDFNLSEYSNNNLVNTGVGNFKLNGAKLTNLDQTTNSLTNFVLENTIFDFASDNTHTYGLSEAVVHGNTIKYQFEKGLSGLGDGNVSIPRFVAPGAGWYIEKTLIDCTPLVISGTISFSLGLQLGFPEVVLDNVDSSVLTDKVKVYDIASNTLIAHKSTELDWIGLFVHDETGSSTITSGTMSIEVTLKNTNYNTIWWNL